MKTVVALDLDGVINEFSWNLAGHVGPWARLHCVAHLDRVLSETDSDFVLASTWRGLVREGDMTLRGFGWLLMTHGMREHRRLVGITPRLARLADRGAEIREWWRANPQYDRLVAIDDMELGHAAWGIPLVQTDGRVGLTAADADRAIAILKGEDR